jgi:Ni/Fe-hydrogenase 1 B-type cytochrome subunit
MVDVAYKGDVMNLKTQDCDIKQELEFTTSYRWQHWIRAISIVALTVTGFYIAIPFIQPAVGAEPTKFLYALMRSWHLIFGFVLIGVILYKTFMFLFVKDSSMERKALKDLFNPKIWTQQIGYYLLFSKHPKLSGIYNPLQFVAYVVFYLMIFGLILTGLILYIHVYHNGFAGAIYAVMRNFEVMFGGLAVVREVHHILMWGVIIFVVGHVYMAIYNAVFGKEGAMDAIFSGIKWHKKH